MSRMAFRGQPCQNSSKISAGGFLHTRGGLGHVISEVLKFAPREMLRNFFSIHQEEQSAQRLHYLSPEIVQWVGGLPCEAVGSKSSSLPRNAGRTYFLAGIPCEYFLDIVEPLAVCE